MLRRIVGGGKRLLARATRFRLSTLLLAMTIGAILLAWRRDHLRLQAEIERMQNPNPHWGADEATGLPNTSGYGDINTAWASQSADGQKEWIMLEFERASPAAIHVYETYNPGAITKITRVTMFGGEQTLWEGTDPTPPTRGGGVSKFATPNAPGLTRIKIYLDSPAFPGWNEIDAVALIDAQGQPYWALRAVASSSYGRNGSLQSVW